MTASPDVAAVLETIPGWESASFRRLDGGLANDTYLVERDGARAVLKIDAEPREPPLNTRAQEAAVQKAASAEGLGSRVLHVSDTVLLSEYADGNVCASGDFDDDRRLEELAGALRRLHSLPLTGRVFDAARAAARYFESLGDADPVIAERCLKTVTETGAPSNLCCCHNDLVADNIIGSDGIRFIDWEFACDNDPFFDLATIVVEHQLSTEQVVRLLDAYFDGDGASWQRQLAVQERLYEALAWLWRESRRGI